MGTTDALRDRLEMFDAVASCPKCASDDIMAGFEEGIHNPGCSLRREFLPVNECCHFPHIERLCRRCKFKWAELPLDTPADQWRTSITSSPTGEQA